MRKFAWINAYRHLENDLALPVRTTEGSAGYDLAAAESLTIAAGQTLLVPTGLKVYMEPTDVLLIIIRSSLAVKNHLVLANQVGVIDRDYVDNDSNEGHIMVPILNLAQSAVAIERGQRVAQAIFVSYQLTDDDQARGQRYGGFGSTGPT